MYLLTNTNDPAWWKIKYDGGASTFHGRGWQSHIAEDVREGMGGGMGEGKKGRGGKKRKREENTVSQRHATNLITTSSAHSNRTLTISPDAFAGRLKWVGWVWFRGKSREDWGGEKGKEGEDLQAHWQYLIRWKVWPRTCYVTSGFFSASHHISVNIGQVEAVKSYSQKQKLWTRYAFLLPGDHHHSRGLSVGKLRRTCPPNKPIISTESDGATPRYLSATRAHTPRSLAAPSTRIDPWVPGAGSSDRVCRQRESCRRGHSLPNPRGACWTRGCRRCRLPRAAGRRGRVGRRGRGEGCSSSGGDGCLDGCARRDPSRRRSQCGSVVRSRNTRSGAQWVWSSICGIRKFCPLRQFVACWAHEWEWWHRFVGFW